MDSAIHLSHDRPLDEQGIFEEAIIIRTYLLMITMHFRLGFIMMTPQLFINYKMKSVAHLPWRMLTYKALNTFIDDLFAFIIKMPTLYRLGCLRDGKFSICALRNWIM